MRANQKDTFFISSLHNQLQEVLRLLKGQRWVNSNPEEITVFSKALYFLVTTVIGARTLGEEYVDIMYVNRLGKRMPRMMLRIMFASTYVILPYIISRIVRKLRSGREEDDSYYSKFFSSYKNTIDTIINIHTAIFYFEGMFYSLSKRFTGMRYVFGHNKDPSKLQKTGNYTVLGGIILLQFAVKMLIKIKQYSENQDAESIDSQPKIRGNVDKIDTLQQLSYAQESLKENKRLAEFATIDLSDPKQLPYIPSSSRSCMLCLSLMVNPAAANCGHMFCWECIVGWVREHPECPLCRQVCMEQNLLPLR